MPKLTGNQIADMLSEIASVVDKYETISENEQIIGVLVDTSSCIYEWNGVKFNSLTNGTRIILKPW